MEILSPLVKNRKATVTTSFDYPPAFSFLVTPTTSSSQAIYSSSMPHHLIIPHDHLFTHVA